MKQLTIIRHAKSSWDDMSLADHERPLNRRGKRDAPFMAQLMASKGWRPDLLISSPAVRAHTTATFFAESLGVIPESIQLEERIYEASLMSLRFLVQSFDDQYDHVAIFGHNPGFGMLANTFYKDNYISNLPTCGIVEVVGEVESWANFTEKTALAKAYHFPKQYQ